MSKHWMTLLLAVATAIALAGCGKGAVEEEGAEAEEGPQQPVEIQATKARVETLRPVAEMVGTLVAVPENVAYIAAQAEGQVDKVLVQEGQTVKAGEPVVLLDTRMAVAEAAKAQADAEEARAALALLQRGPLPLEVETARQQLQTATSNAEGLRVKLKALEPLHANKEISPVQYEQAQSALKAAEGSQAEAEAQLKLVQSGSRPEALAEAKAHVASAEADLAARQLAVKLCTLTSPIDGVVTELTARSGMAVQPSDHLASVVNLSKVFAQFQFPANILSKVQVGAAVSVALNIPDDTPRAGTLARIGNVANPQSGEVAAFASLANEDGSLRPGLGCRVQITLPEIPNAVLVPVQAVADRDGTPVVTLVRDDKAYETEVVTGSRTPEAVQVVKGVAAGDVVALEGGYGLPEGCPVKIIEPKKEANGEEPSKSSKR